MSYEITEEEVRLDVLGTYQEQIKYIAGLLQYRFPDLDNKVFAAVGSALKKFPFEVVLLGAKTVTEVTSGSIFPKLNYAASSYHSVRVSSKDFSKSKERAEAAQRRSLDEEEIRKKGEYLKNPDLTLMQWVIGDRITQQEFASVQGNEEAKLQLIKEVVSRGKG